LSPWLVADAFNINQCMEMGIRSQHYASKTNGFQINKMMLQSSAITTHCDTAMLPHCCASHKAVPCMSTVKQQHHDVTCLKKRDLLAHLCVAVSDGLMVNHQMSKHVHTDH